MLVGERQARGAHLGKAAAWQVEGMREGAPAHGHLELEGDYGSR